MITQRLRAEDEGFTLIELLVVIIIIGVLASIAIPTFLNQRAKANESAMKADLRNVAVFAETFWADNGTYVGFEADPLYTTYNGTQNVTLDVLSTTSTAYCIQAVHALVPDVWYFDSVAQQRVTDIAC